MYICYYHRLCPWSDADVVLGRSIFRLPIPVVDMIKLGIATIIMSLALWPVAQFKGAGAGGANIHWIIIYGAILVVLIYWLSDENNQSIK